MDDEIKKAEAELKNSLKGIKNSEAIFEAIQNLLQAKLNYLENDIINRIEKRGMYDPEY